MYENDQLETIFVRSRRSETVQVVTHPRNLYKQDKTSVSPQKQHLCHWVFLAGYYTLIIPYKLKREGDQAWKLESWWFQKLLCLLVSWPLHLGYKLTNLGLLLRYFYATKDNHPKTYFNLVTRIVNTAFSTNFIWIFVSQRGKLETLLNAVSAFSLFKPTETAPLLKSKVSKTWMVFVISRCFLLNPPIFLIISIIEMLILKLCYINFNFQWMLTAYLMYMSVYCIGWYATYRCFFGRTVHEIIASGRKRFFLGDLKSNITLMSLNGTILKYDLYSNENILVGSADMALKIRGTLDHAFFTMFFSVAVSTTFWSASKRFQDFLAGIECFCVESATNAGSSHSFEAAKIMEKYKELRNLVASLNSVWSTMVLFYVISWSLNYIFHMKQGIESWDFSTMFSALNMRFFFVVMLFMLADGCKTNASIKLWLCGRGCIHEEVFPHRKNELECLEKRLEIEPNGIGTVGMFEINYGFLAQLAIFCVTAFLITF
ncbi:unnamed protein product [Orchesella dallaii]|uniref:Gustatory receptor n=1 Tax=Orchesella dallaii TaxID=48710 RepID=A0ABP1QRG8_9HEXA